MGHPLLTSRRFHSGLHHRFCCECPFHCGKFRAGSLLQVCTTELGTVAKYGEHFASRGVKVAALSCDNAESHKAWIADIESATWSDGKKIDYPIIADDKRELAVKLGMIDPDEKDAAGLPMTARAVFVIGKDKKLKLSLLYPASTGRNFDEVIRVIDSLQLTANHSVATPVNWKSALAVSFAFRRGGCACACG